MKTFHLSLIALVSLAASACAFAHVSLEAPLGEAGRAYRAVLRIGNGCDKAATSTSGLKTPAGLLQVLSPADFAMAQALPKVDRAWARSTVPGQQGTGAFMRLSASKAMQLVGVATPVAGTAEVHEMKMEGSIMRMRAVPHLDLPAGQTTELKPGGYHIMLLDLKQPLANGSVVPLTLLFRAANGAQSKLEVKVPVAMTAPGGSGPPTDGHKH